MVQLKSTDPSQEATNDNDNTLVPGQNHEQEMIEAEIVEQNQLVHQPLPSETDDELTLESLTLSEDSSGGIFTLVPSWLEYLSTPWAMGSLGLLLFANVLLSGVQLYNGRNLTEAQNSLDSLSPIVSSDNLPISEPLNLAKTSSESVPLDALSTLSFQRSKESVKSTPEPLAVSPKPVNLPQKSSNLTQALLPPSLQPQIMTSYGVAPNVVPVANPQKVTNEPLPPVTVPQAVVPVNIQPPPPPIPSNNQLTPPGTVSTLSQPNNSPAPKPKIEIYPPSNNPQASKPRIEIYPPSNNPQAPKIEIYPPSNSHNPQAPKIEIYPPSGSNNPEVSQDEKARQMILQQVKREQTDASPSPLGFNNKTRLEMQNTQNKIAPTQLPRQIKQLEHLQQRRILDQEK